MNHFVRVSNIFFIPDETKRGAYMYRLQLKFHPFPSLRGSRGSALAGQWSLKSFVTPMDTPL